MKIKLYDLDQSVYDTYKFSVKGNRNVSFLLARKKISRALALSTCILGDENAGVYVYGKMLMVVKGNMVVFLANHMPCPKEWSFKKRNYLHYSRMLGIDAVLDEK